MGSDGDAVTNRRTRRDRLPSKKLLAESRALDLASKQILSDERAACAASKKFLAFALAMEPDAEKQLWADALTAEAARDDLLVDLLRGGFERPVDDLGYPDFPGRGRVDRSTGDRLHSRHGDTGLDGWYVIERIIERATRYVAMLVLLLNDDDGQADEPAEQWIALTPDHVPVRDLSPGVAQLRAHTLLTAAPPASPASTHRGSLLAA